MTAAGAIVPSFADELVAYGILLPPRTRGVWGRSDAFERVVQGIERLVDGETAGDGTMRLRFPPVIAREDFEHSDFLKSFPHLAGEVFAFDGDHTRHQTLLERVQARAEWADLVSMTGVVLVPAACYPVYPALSGALPEGGRVVDVSSYCFRHEPSDDPARMIAFRMRENVCLGSPDDVVAFRDAWIDRAVRMFRELSVDARPAVANDPFFGRGGRLLAHNQREQKLKFELVVPIGSVTEPTAVMSFNYHQDHFGEAFGITTADGSVAHTACVGFGLERVALALFRTHGCVCEAWPERVRQLLQLG
jgi:seryl-tRNA synthetase